jgi:hypothetical protein
MRIKHFLTFISIGFLIVASVVLIGKVLAQEIIGGASVQYPVQELGGCQNKTACQTYCDKPENMEACLDFAERNNLMSQEEIEQAKKFIAAGSEGPGGCQTKDSCEEYCNDISHIDECISFAEKNDLIPPEELAEAKQVQAAIKKGVKPPACGNKKACEVYCDNPEHMEECISFAKEAGFLQGKELEDAQKMLAAVKKGITPPPCHGKEECDVYCGDPDHMEACMTFAMEAGFMTEQEKADAEKMLQAIKKGVKPPNCQGKEECDVYCSTEEHFEECLNFAEAAGFMSPEDAAMARKTGGKGPGGCRGKDECEAFCNNPENQETCFNFAKENGLISEEDLKQMEEGKQKFKESLEQAPPQVLECLNSQMGTETMEKFKSGQAMPTQEIGEQMRQCYEQAMPMMPPGAEQGPGNEPGQPGPGGCQSPEECQDYCSSHPEECQNFGQPPSGGAPGGQPPAGEGQYPGPGGPPCQTPEECQQMMVPPIPCEGEGCQPGPGQFQPGPEQFQPGEQPPSGTFPPGEQMPPAEQAPPAEQTPPPAESSPAPESSPPPSSLITPQSFLGSLLNTLYPDLLPVK